MKGVVIGMFRSVIISSMDLLNLTYNLTIVLKGN